MVSPDSVAGLTFADPVDEVNKVVATLKDGDATNGEADVIVVEYHEGAGGSGTLATELANSAVFAKIVNTTDARVNAIFTAHTHQTYAYLAPVPGDAASTRPVVQSGSYAGNVGKVELVVDQTAKVVCGAPTAVNIPVSGTAPFDTSYPRVAAAQAVLKAALDSAATLGSVVVGQATQPISRALQGTGDLRDRESTMTNLVAQMFKETLGADDPNFIGIQNPGGTRADFATAGDITYAGAAAVLPFANTLMTRQVTGADLKKILEQQWQQNAAGVPLATGRQYLALGASDNLSWTYDATRPLNDRITSIVVSGKRVDPAATYTVGSGSFLVTGGDNFHAFKSAYTPVDTGKADLEAWVDWIKAKGSVSPSFARRGVSVHVAPKVLYRGVPYTFQVGFPQIESGRTAALAPDTLDITRGRSTLANTTLEAITHANPAARALQPGEVLVGTAPVTDGQSTITVTYPTTSPLWPAGEVRFLELRAASSETVALLPVMLLDVGALSVTTTIDGGSTAAMFFGDTVTVTTVLTNTGAAYPADLPATLVSDVTALLGAGTLVDS